MLVLLDLDGFKSYNDSFGHPAGDSLLVRLGARLDEVARPYGRAYRLGGDEFCVLADVRGRARADVRGRRGQPRRCPTHGDGFTVRASSGTVRLPDEAATPAEALHLADRRMYADKAPRPRRRRAARPGTC